jgi:hypothetical protein
VLGAGRKLTVDLVVLLRTVKQIVTQTAGVQTRPGPATAVEAWTAVVLTPFFILLPRAVKDAVTTREDRQAVAVVWTLVVGVWTRHVDGLWQEVVTVVPPLVAFRLWNDLAGYLTDWLQLNRDVMGQHKLG